MKKIVLALAVVFSVAMVSCGGNKTNDAAADSDTVVAIEETEVVEVVDSAAPAADSVAPVADSAAVAE